jgi:hypothetical protein
MPHHTTTQTKINSVTPDPSKNQRNPLPPASSLQPPASIAAEYQDRRAPDHQIVGPSGSPRSLGPDRQTAGSLESQIAERQIANRQTAGFAERQTRTCKPDPDCRRPDAAGNPSPATSPDLQTATAVGLERPTTQWVLP